MVIRSPPVTVPLAGNMVAMIGGAKLAFADSVLETIVRVRAAPTKRDTNLRMFEFNANIVYCPSKIDIPSRNFYQLQH